METQGFYSLRTVSWPWATQLKQKYWKVARCMERRNNQAATLKGKIASAFLAEKVVELGSPSTPGSWRPLGWKHHFHVEKLPEASEPQPKGLIQVLERILRHKGKEMLWVFLISGALLPSFLSLNTAAKLVLVPQLPDERTEPCKLPVLGAWHRAHRELASAPDAE